MVQRFLFIVLTCALVQVAPGVAQAATVSLQGGTLAYTSATGQKDAVSIYLSDRNGVTGAAESVVTLDLDGASATPGPGFELCARENEFGTGDRISCPAAAVQRVTLTLGDGDDLASVYALCTDPNSSAANGCVAAGQAPTVTADLGAGKDTFYGVSASGSDGARHGAMTVTGGSGNDVIWGGNGDDRLDGGAGSDDVQGYLGDDTIIGGAGNDKLYGNYVCLVACAGPGDADVLQGGAGADTMSGGRGPDVHTGGAGNDKFYDSNDGKRDRVDGGTGRDTLDGVDFSRKTYRFKDKLASVERITDGRMPPAYRWDCKGRRCTVAKINYRPPTAVIIVFF